ncbi:MAG: hypothetical protein ACXWWU_05660 [Candidatus Limnocylindria bacterium]
MSRAVRIGLGVVLALGAIVGIGVGYTLLVGTRPDIGNADLATVQRTLPGTWVLEETSQADFIAGLVDEFDEADLRSEMSDLKLGDPVHISLTIAGEVISATSIADGVTTELGDGTYRLVDNHTMSVTRGDCVARVQFRLQEDVLTFGIIGACPTELSDLALAVLLRGAPFNRAPAT